MGHHCRMASLQIYWDTILTLAFRCLYRSDPFQKLITVGITDTWCIVLGGTLLSYWSNEVFIIFKSHLKGGFHYWLTISRRCLRKLERLFGTPAANVGTGIGSHLWWIEGFHDWSITVKDKLKIPGIVTLQYQFGVKFEGFSLNGALLGLVLWWPLNYNRLRDGEKEPLQHRKSWGWDTLRRMPAAWWSCAVPKSWLKLLQGRRCKDSRSSMVAAGLGSRTWLPGVLLWPTNEQQMTNLDKWRGLFLVRLFPYYVPWVFSCIYLPFCFPYTIPYFPSSSCIYSRTLPSVLLSRYIISIFVGEYSPSVSFSTK